MSSRLYQALTRAQSPPRQPQTVFFQGWPMGLNTVVPDSMIGQREMAECTNWRINKLGQLETRYGFTKLTDTAVAAVKFVGSVVLGSTEYDIITDADGKVYYLDGATPTLIGTADGVCSVKSYNGAALVLDGGYLKYFTDTTGLKLAYDAGTDGALYDNYSGTNDGSINLGDGTNTHVGIALTTPSWGAGYTLPPRQFTVKIGTYGNGYTGTDNQPIKAQVRDDSWVLVAEKNLLENVSSLTGTPDFHTVTFADSDIVSELAPGSTYYFVLEYTNGDINHHLIVSHTDVTSGGAAYVYTGTGAADTTKDPIMRVGPGLPPKATMAAIKNRRLWLGGDTDNPGWLWYSNYSYLDWHTSGASGYLGVIDNSRNNFPVGGLATLYGELFVYGTERQPFLGRVEGDTPTDFVVSQMFQRQWTTQATLVNTVNDLWSCNGGGVDALSGVQAYGDVRSHSESAPVANRISGHFDESTAFAGYCPEEGQYWLWMPTLAKALVCHTRLPVPDEAGRLRYPWVEYSFGVTPTCFGNLSEKFCIGASDGYVYHHDRSTYKDDGTDYTTPFRTAYIDVPFGSLEIETLQLLSSSVAGGSVEVSLYKNSEEADPVHTWTVSLPMSSAITVDEMTMTVDEAIMSWNAQAHKAWVRVRAFVRSFQVRVKDTQNFGKAIYINGIILKNRRVEV